MYDITLLLHMAVAALTCLVFALSAVLSCYYCLVHMRLIRPVKNPCIAMIPLESLERWLLKFLYAGSISFTVLLVSSFYWLSKQAMATPQGLVKIALSLAAWLLLTSLSVGRRYFGWRGEITAAALSLGAALLCAIYIWA